MRTLCIGPVAFDIPDWLDTRDDEGTLVAYPPKTDYANLRVTISTIAKDDKPSPGAGERILRSIAAKDGRELHEAEGKVWYNWSQPASDGSPGSTIEFWHVGFAAHTVLVSCFIDSADGDSTMKQRVLDAVLPMIQSFRVNKPSA